MHLSSVGVSAEWRKYLMGFAQHAATKSKDTTQVGAAIVNSKTVLMTGYNGPPAGVGDMPRRRERPAKYLFASHAEQNTIAFAARHGICTNGADIYVTHMPCAACARSIIQAGIVRVCYGSGKTSMPADEFEAARVMLSEAGVLMEEVDG